MEARIPGPHARAADNIELLRPDCEDVEVPWSDRAEAEQHELNEQRQVAERMAAAFGSPDGTPITAGHQVAEGEAILDTGPPDPVDEAADLGIDLEVYHQG